MDKRTKGFLAKLGQQIPREMLGRAVRKEAVQNTEALMERIAATKPKEERIKIIEALKQGQYAGKERYVNDSKAGNEINKWMGKGRGGEKGKDLGGAPFLKKKQKPYTQN